jgi:uncharacterized protein
MLSDNVVHFARILRQAGMPIGPDRIVHAMHALDAVGLRRRADVHAALSAVMLDRREHQPLFDLAFDTFWRDPKLLEQMMFALLPKVQGRGDRPPVQRPRRLQEALQPARAPSSNHKPNQADAQEIHFDAALSFSERERLQTIDFESMTVDEFKQAQAMIRTWPLPSAPIRLRRFEPALRGVADLRATLHNMVRHPSHLLPAYRQARQAPPPLVVLLDVSGSMDRYARIFLHYAHALMQHQRRVQVFTFGTRLSNISRRLKARDPDDALAQIGAQVQDWRGGTRIASSLRAFNRHWARRVLGGRATLLLVTDGLDRDPQGDLGEEAARLHRLAHRIVWLNPLLRFAGFEPKAAGIRALLGHVDQFRPVHNLQSLADLGRALAH